MAARYVYMVLWMYNDDFPFSMCWLAGWQKDGLSLRVSLTYLGRPRNAYFPMVADILTYNLPLWFDLLI